MQRDVIKKLQSHFDTLAQKIPGEEIEFWFARGIKPEHLPPEEDIMKLERRIKSEEKKLIKQSGKLPKLMQE